MKIPLTLGYDSDARKRTPMLATVFGYFAAAMAGLARHCVRSNDKHNPGEPVHWARGKSMDHDECSLRHLVDSAEIRAWLRANPTHPERDAVVTMLEYELDAKVWRASAESQEFYEEFRAAPLSFSSRLPAPVPSGTVEEPFNASAFLQEFAAPSDPAKLPQIVDGAPWREPWAIIDGNGNLLSLHSAYADAESCMRAMMAPEPVNTPEELAELVKMQGVVRLVGGPGLVDGGHVEHPPVICSTPGCWGNPGHEGAHLDLDGKTVPDLAAESADDVAFALPPYLDEAEQSRVDALSDRDEQAMRGLGTDETGLDRCGVMSSTKRVCTRMGGHAGAHADAVVQWAGIE